MNIPGIRNDTMATGLASRHLVLLGDSILDNAAYVRGGPAVIDQVRGLLGEGWRASLLASDGDVIAGVHRQLERLPGDASHLALSVGGNDVLGEIGILRERVGDVGESLRRLAEIRDRFEEGYRSLIRAIADRGLPAVVCTIYNASTPDESFQRESAAALGLFNDRIISVAREFRLPAIDLRAVCTEAADYANPIEPSSAGGAKIAARIVEVVQAHDFSRRQAALFP